MTESSKRCGSNLGKEESAALRSMTGDPDEVEKAAGEVSTSGGKDLILWSKSFGLVARLREFLASIRLVEVSAWLWRGPPLLGCLSLHPSRHAFYRDSRAAAHFLRESWRSRCWSAHARSGSCDAAIGPYLAPRVKVVHQWVCTLDRHALAILTGGYMSPTPALLLSRVFPSAVSIAARVPALASTLGGNALLLVSGMCWRSVCLAGVRVSLKMSLLASLLCGRLLLSVPVRLICGIMANLAFGSFRFLLLTKVVCALEA